jgi:hypothetical protein
MKKQEIENIIHGMLHVARPLEVARIRHLLSDGSLEDIVIELRKYQNPDGGFGHGLEPDFWNPASSATQSWFACHIIRDHGIDPFHPMVVALLDYLKETFDDHIMRWHAIDQDNINYPHAPWWEKEGSLVSFNPSASLAGFIVKYGHPMDAMYKKARKVIDEALSFILEREEPVEPHELRCLIDMMNDIALDYRTHQHYKRAKNKMILLIDEALEKDEELWFTSYVTKPSQLIKHHPSLGSEVFHDLLLKEIDLAINHLNAEYLWPITWHWMGAYPDAFEIANQHWQGIIAYGYVKLIKDLGIPFED